MALSEKNIYVYENWENEEPSLIGFLRSSFIRGTENFSFEYADEWLKQQKGGCVLDPNLSFYRGRQYMNSDNSLFGLFLDSCPDRWGRLLMTRREALKAGKENRKPRKLTESDFLLGVCDEARMGALRFALEKNGEFLSYERGHSIPPWVKLRTLEHASFAFEKDDAGMDEQWLKELLAPGFSLGGARPKATVQAADGTLWIAKFPSRHDEYNSGAWEMTVHDLARQCFLDVPEARLENLSKNGSTFLTQRFDRCGKRRIHFESAMTLLGKTDGSSAEDGTGYTDLAEFIRANGAEPRKDLEELWKRIVFSMAVSNTDDHLRNHGFLLTSSGWRLSPLFDVNPVPYGDHLTLNITETDSRIDLSLAAETAGYFGISLSEAEEKADKIVATVQKNWIKTAEKNGLGRNAIEYMRPAFSLGT